MRKLLLSLTMMVCFAVGAKADPTAKAIYCSGNTTLYITFDEVTYTEGTAYDNLDGNTVTKSFDIPENGYFSMPNMTSSMNDDLRYNSQNYNAISKAYGGENGELSTIVFLESCKDWRPTSLRSLFNDLQKLTTVIGGDNLNTSEVTSMERTFENCRSLPSLDFLSTWDTSKVTSLEATFSHCISLTDLNPLGNENWDVSKVKIMRGAFTNCSSLTDISGLSNWNPSSVVNFMSTFCSCRALEDFTPLANWDVSKAIEMAYMFYYCLKMPDLEPFANWKVDNVEDMGYLFGCTDIKEAKPLKSWNTSKVKFMGEFFLQCKSLESLEGLENWNTENVQSLTQMFDGCSSLLSVEPLKNWNTSNVYSMYRTFSLCESLTGRVDLSNWDLSHIGEGQTKISITDPQYTQYWGNAFQGLTQTFFKCGNIIGVTFGTGNLGKVGTFRTNCTFYECSKLRYIDLSGLTDTHGMAVSASRESGANSWSGDMFYKVPRTTVIYLPSGNTEAEESDHENVVYTASDGTLQCDKYYSEDKVDIEMPHRFHADLATYERPAGREHGSVVLPYPIEMEDNDDAEFQPFLLQEEHTDHMFFKGSQTVPANTPFVYLRKTQNDMNFRMEDVWVESTYDNIETSDNIHEDFAWTAQGFYVKHEIEPVNGVFNIPTMDDYPMTSTYPYGWDHVYYLAKNRFYRSDDYQAMKIAPHRVLFYGLWTKFSETDPDFVAPSEFSFEEVGLVDAIKDAEMRMNADKAEGIYDINGNRLNEMQRGLNILRMSDGSVKKVIVK